MLRNVKDLRGYGIRASDGVIGKVDDFYFDDETWAIRYLVVDTGTWLSGRKVLISPIALGHAGWMGRQLPVALTRAQVERSPDIDTKKPVSRQHEAQYFGYYGYPYFWGGAGLWGMGAYPGSLTAQGRIEEDLKAHASHATPPRDDCHLRSTNAVIGYHIKATDGDIGHLEDLLVDDHTWAISHLIVNTSNWWGGQRVLIPPHSIKDVSWPEATVSVGLSRQAVKDAPAYTSAAQVDRESEPIMSKRYRRPGRSTLRTRHHRPPGRVHHAVRDDVDAGSHEGSS
jgi:sporulation protein YlmC with PRC-barrel domain